MAPSMCLNLSAEYRAFRCRTPDPLWHRDVGEHRGSRIPSKSSARTIGSHVQLELWREARPTRSPGRAASPHISRFSMGLGVKSSVVANAASARAAALRRGHLPLGEGLSDQE